MGTLAGRTGPVHAERSSSRRPVVPLKWHSGVLGGTTLETAPELDEDRPAMEPGMPRG